MLAWQRYVDFTVLKCTRCKHCCRGNVITSRDNVQSRLSPCPFDWQRGIQEVKLVTDCHSSMTLLVLSLQKLCLFIFFFTLSHFFPFSCPLLHAHLVIAWYNSSSFYCCSIFHLQLSQLLHACIFLSFPLFGNFHKQQHSTILFGPEGLIDSTPCTHHWGVKVSLGINLGLLEVSLQHLFLLV